MVKLSILEENYNRFILSMPTTKLRKSFNDISTFVGNLMPKQSCRTVLVLLLHITGEDKGFHTIPKGISLKENAIDQLEFKFDDNHITVRRQSLRNFPYYSFK